MNPRRSQLYLAHCNSPADPLREEADTSDYVAEMDQKEAAEYIAALVGSLRAIAVKNQLPILSDLLAVAEEEARLHGRQQS